MSTPQISELVNQLSCEVLTDPADYGEYTHDASDYEAEGTPLGVVFAEKTEDVSAALKWANENRVPVSIRGAGTGIAGGAAAYQNGLVLALNKMNKILALDPVNKLADIQPGVITAELDAAANEHGLFFAPDPASAKISTVGGNIATNAGGLRCVAHGVTLEAVAALEVVLANGDIIHTGSRTIKDVSGYNLTQLFVGSEGTLGIITGATVRLKTAPKGEPYTFSAHFDSMTDAAQAVFDVVNNAKPEALELMDAFCVETVERHFPSGLKVPEAALVLGLCVGEDAKEQAEQITELCKGAGASEVAVAQGHELMNTRRKAQPALAKENINIFGDVSVPMSELTTMTQRIEEISQRTGKKVAVVAHAGDGNLHPTVESGDTPEQMEEGLEVLSEIVKAAIELGGVITGEHGIGALKQHELNLQFSEQTLAVQRAIKAALDPNNILTPNRVI